MERIVQDWTSRKMWSLGQNAARLIRGLKNVTYKKRLKRSVVTSSGEEKT